MEGRNERNFPAPGGFMEEPIPYRIIQDIYPVARWDSCGRYCIRVVIPDGSLLFQVSNCYMREQWLHSLLWKKSIYRYRKLLDCCTRLMDVDKWANPDEGPRYFDLISCLNLLDRCDRPITLLQQIRSKLNPDTGILILAVVLPLSQYVESGSKYNQPSEKITVKGRKFEEQAAYLATHLFQENGFQVLRWTRLPYLCEGDLDQAFYWLNDALFVMKVADPCDS
ncbi:Methyltransferase-like protein 9 like protein [Argiope bruennichi]|uniref:Methyltransferase-like protein 9 like protein n=1 Tax=Argiope bruennichi TaxID=94029 RepID=A0A8T0EID7_ARGBR|nr:Methyltransferase-like protein 9 like protein [Argiope bruennichi]